MVLNEKELAKAIMRCDSRIELHKDLIGGVEKIKNPSEVVWKSVAAVLITSAFFWGRSSSCNAWYYGWITCYTRCLWRCRGSCVCYSWSIRNTLCLSIIVRR